MKKISIITPNYNYSEFLPALFESIINQSYQNWEHIIVDDGSTDNSVDIIRSYAVEYPDKVKLISQENRGQTFAINRALTEVTGDIIGWINSDDYYVSDIFTEVIKIFNEKPDVEIVFGDYNIVDMAGNFISSKKNLRFKYFEGVFVGFGNLLTSNTVFWRRSLLEEVRTFNEKMLSNMDGEFFSRLTYGNKVYKLNFPIANFRRQIVSKAGVGRTDWDSVVKQERKLEFVNSYNNLLISKFIPFRVGKNFKIFILFYRKVLKLLYT